jgi:hypothetical protein
VAAAIVASDARGRLGAVDAAAKGRLLADAEASVRAVGAAFLVLALAQAVGLAAAACLFVRTRPQWRDRFAGLTAAAAAHAHGLELRGIVGGVRGSAGRAAEKGKECVRGEGWGGRARC